MASDTLNSAEIAIGGGVDSMTGSTLMDMLMGEDIIPGMDPSYQLCKTLYLYHPLGAKMTEGPISMAQSQERDIAIQDAPDEVKAAFLAEWETLEADEHILNVHGQSRVYGIASLVLGIKGFPSDKPADMEKLYDQEVFFNVLDPLNTAGSLVLSQSTKDPNYQRPITVRTSGDTYHPSRFQVVMNEKPIFISYTNSGFGFVGRSVYQRALFAMKSFIRSMIADDMIQTKLGVVVANQKQPGSVINQAMAKVAAWKRSLVKRVQTGQVISIGPEGEEKLSTLDMQNVDGAGTYSRNNIIRNIETAADMPAKMLDQETMVSGFGEGTEDANNRARYVGRIRIKLRRTYKWFENIVQYRAWNPVWYKSVIQAKYPEKYGGVDFRVAFSEWRSNFVAEWPSLLIEPDSEAIKKEEIVLEAVVAFLNSYLPQLDAANKAVLLQWGADIINQNKKLFPHELELDWETLAEHQEDLANQQQEMHDSTVEGTEEDQATKRGGSGFRLDAANFERLRSKVARLGIREKPNLLPSASGGN